MSDAMDPPFQLFFRLGMTSLDHWCRRRGKPLGRTVASVVSQGETARGMPPRALCIHRTAVFVSSARSRRAGNRCALPDALTAERARVDQLLTDLADAGAAERISADAAAAFRHQLVFLLARRPWWRGWFR